MADLTSFWKMRLFEEFSNNVLSNTNSILAVYFEVAFAFISPPKCNLRHWEQTKWMNFQSDENKFYFKVSCCLELQKTYFLPRQPNFLSHTWDSKTFQKEPRPKSFIRLLCKGQKNNNFRAKRVNKFQTCWDARYLRLFEQPFFPYNIPQHLWPRLHSTMRKTLTRSQCPSKCEAWHQRKNVGLEKWPS